MKRLLVFPLLSLALAWPATSAGAASSVEAGWWTSAPVAAPDVPSGGLAVQGGPDASSPVAFSAVSFALGSGETPQSFALSVNGNSATTPNAKLMACPLTTTFAPASGAAMSQAPKYSCETSTTASPASDGKTYSFDVSKFAPQGALAVAILPTQATDRVVFDAPTPSALTSTTAPSSTSPESSVVGDASSSSAAYQSVPSSGGASFEVPSSPVPDVPPPASGSLGPDTARQATADATQTAAAAPVTSSSKSHGRVLVPMAVGLALLAAALWLVAGAGSGGVPELAEDPS